MSELGTLIVAIVILDKLEKRFPGYVDTEIVVTFAAAIYLFIIL